MSNREVFVIEVSSTRGTITVRVTDPAEIDNLKTWFVKNHSPHADCIVSKIMKSGTIRRADLVSGNY